MIDLFVARRRLMGKEKYINPYEGWYTGRIYNGNVSRWSPVNSGTTTGKKVSPAYPVTGGHVVVYNYDSQARLPKDVNNSDYAEQSMKAFTSSGGAWGSVGANGYNGARNTKVKNVVTLASNITSMIVCTTFGLDDFFFYDRTAGEYIYRGKNVTANSQ